MEIAAARPLAARIPWRIVPATLLIAQIPFQSWITREYGVTGNLLTAAILVAFLLPHRVYQLPRLLLGTWTQRLALLAVVGTR